jgi:large subunit ribosomal protein L4
MQIDIVNNNNEKVGAIDVRDEVFGGRVNAGLIWESVVRQNASERRGTHMTKTRGLVSGTGKKPWRQKGTGRAQVGDARNPLWRKGGTVFGPVPRSYDYSLPKKVERGALRAALSARLQDGSLVVVESLTQADVKTQTAVETLKRLGVTGKAVLIDVVLDGNFAKSVRNIPGINAVPSSRLTARDVINARRVIATKGALEKLQEALA